MPCALCTAIAELRGNAWHELIRAHAVPAWLMNEGRPGMQHLPCTSQGLHGCMQTLRYSLYGKLRRTFLAHGGDWYERIREFFRSGSHPSLEQALEP